VDDGMAISPTTPVRLSGVGGAVMPITLRNTGTSTWTGAYILKCVSTCDSAGIYDLGGVAPGGTMSVTLEISLSAPFSTSVMDSQWRLEDNGIPFGSPVNIKITQTAAVPVLQSSAPWCSDPGMWTTTHLGSGNSVTCTSSGTVLQSTNWTGPGLWLSSSPAGFNSSWYRLRVHVRYNALTSNEWASLFADATNSALCPSTQTDFAPTGEIQTHFDSTAECSLVHHTWAANETTGQDATLGFDVDNGTGLIFVNGLPRIVGSLPNGGTPALAMGSGNGATAQVTFSDFELFNDVAPYTTYVLY
jgi:hypothetical protein